jgi:hypothetical protein
LDGKVDNISIVPTQVVAEPVDSAVNEAGPSKRFALVVVGALTFLFLASLFYTPTAVQPDGSYFTICGFKTITGLPCPGCGLTHSFCSLGQGDVRASFSFNALGPPLYLLAAAVWARFLFVLFGWLGPVLKIDRVVRQVVLIRVVVIALCIFGVGRIVYLLAVGTPSFQQAPLTKLIEHLTS